MKRILFSNLLLGLGFFAAIIPLEAAEPVIANVTFAQRAGTKLVDIDFDISDADSDTVTLSVQVSDNSGTVWCTTPCARR